MTLIATLPWYDLPATGSALDVLWQSIRLQLHLTEPDGCELLPIELTRNSDLTGLWQNPGLILSQCCGPDLFTLQAALLEPIARPIFAMLECAPGEYYSHIVTGAKPLSEHPRLVINSLTSRSGCFALLEWLKDQGIKPTSVEVSGSHQESLQRLKQNRADVAAIDAQSWNFLITEQLHIIGRSRPAPAPPFVMHKGSPLPKETLYRALNKAILSDGENLGLGGLMPADRALYRTANLFKYSEDAFPGKESAVSHLATNKSPSDILATF